MLSIVVVIVVTVIIVIVFGCIVVRGIASCGVILACDGWVVVYGVVGGVEKFLDANFG